VDKIIEVVPNKSAKALKNVSLNEPWVPGHFPEKVVLPGTLIIEAMAQTSGFIITDSICKCSVKDNKYGYLCSVEKVKFIKPVIAGDSVIIDAKIKSTFENYVKTYCECRVDDTLIAVGSISFIVK
jgi:3-hydroxymyristoyl/3-hydroxydecanoyl-(acyl carrier protein) dehydratase